MIYPTVKDIVQVLDINMFIETGTLFGDTVDAVSMWFPEKAFKIISIDNDPEKVTAARQRFADNPNVSIQLGNSPSVLDELINTQAVTGEGKELFYLDAHWQAYWPLRDEIKQLLRLEKFAIVIDDFKIPGRPECHCDSYGGQDCSWDYIKGLFMGRRYSLYYPLYPMPVFMSDHPDLTHQGWGLILVGYSEKELYALDTLYLDRAV